MTPTEVLALTSTDEDETELVDPLASMAGSLAAMAQHLTADTWAQEKTDDAAAELADLRREYTEIEALHDGKQALIERVLEICKPSTSKLANTIRAALDPIVTVDTTGPAADLEVDGDGADELGGQLAPEVTVEEWREYARSKGYTGPDVDTANRSQIRTMLGVPHVSSPSCGGGE
jgi:hypothetical protein